jgi:hypothetical protein
MASFIFVEPAGGYSKYRGNISGLPSCVYVAKGELLGLTQVF